MTKNREKKSIFFDSELSKENNESTFILYQKIDKKSKKNREKLFLAQNCLNRIISQLLDNTKKTDIKSRKKNLKIIFGSELSEANNEPTFRIHQKN